MNGITQWEAKEIIREKNARIEALTAKLEEADALLELQNRDISRLRGGAHEAILKVRVQGWENIWAGADRCRSIARAALEGKQLSSTLMTVAGTLTSTRGNALAGRYRARRLWMN